MKKPTSEDLNTYAKEIGFAGFDAGRFLDYWEMRGWLMRPGIQMKDWKAAVRTWRRNQDAWGTSPQQVALEKVDASKKQRERELAECADRIKALRSWRGDPACPFGDPAEEERRLARKVRDNFGPAFLDAVYKEVKS